MKVFQLRVREISRARTTTMLVTTAGSYTDGSFELWTKTSGNLLDYWEVV